MTGSLLSTGFACSSRSLSAWKWNKIEKLTNFIIFKRENTGIAALDAKILLN